MSKIRGICILGKYLAMYFLTEKSEERWDMKFDILKKKLTEYLYSYCKLPKPVNPTKIWKVLRCFY